MKSVIFGIVAAIVFGGFTQVKAEDEAGVFRHIVCFKFKDGTSAAEIAEIEAAFVALRDKIDTILEIEWGTSDNIEPLNDGFTHCFIVTFANKAGLEAYLPHPEHESFKTLLKPKLDKVFVFDYNLK